MHPLLRHEALRPRRHAGAQQHALVGREVGTKQRGLVGGALQRLDQQLVEALPGIVERGRLAEPPGRDRRQLQRLAQQLFGQLGQVAEQGAGLEHARAQRVAEQHVAAACAVGQAGHAEGRIGTQFERVAVVIVLAAQDRVHALQACHGLHPDAAAAHRQVAALDEREAEVARQQRVLEIGFVERSRRQQYDQRRAIPVVTHRAGTRRPTQQRFTQCVEERGQVLHVQVGEHLREHARHDEPVFERIARTGRRLGAVADNPPVTVG